MHDVRTSYPAESHLRKSLLIELESGVAEL